MKEITIDKEHDKTKEISEKFESKLKTIKLELAEKLKIIEQLNINLDKEGEINEKIEHENQKLLKEISSLKSVNKELKDKMNYYKKSCEKMNKELREVYETIGEQKAKITNLEKENEQNIRRLTLHMGSSIPTNLLPTRDTKDYKNLFDYKTTAGLEDPVDEYDEINEFSDLMSMKNKTQIVESLADELDFYDNADDPYTFGNHFINEENDCVKDINNSPNNNLKLNEIK